MTATFPNGTTYTFHEYAGVCVSVGNGYLLVEELYSEGIISARPTGPCGFIQKYYDSEREKDMNNE